MASYFVGRELVSVITTAAEGTRCVLAVCAVRTNSCSTAFINVWMGKKGITIWSVNLHTESHLTNSTKTD